ncbi:hypothetical protein A2U01_0100433, partial [Trifolium medium]|nr:hypothetical protein [Trifolium medium]
SPIVRLGGCASSPMAALASLAALSLFFKILSGSGSNATLPAPESYMH